MWCYTSLRMLPNSILELVNIHLKMASHLLLVLSLNQSCPSGEVEKSVCCGAKLIFFFRLFKVRRSTNCQQ